MPAAGFSAVPDAVSRALLKPCRHWTSSVWCSRSRRLAGVRGPGVPADVPPDRAGPASRRRAGCRVGDVAAPRASCGATFALREIASPGAGLGDERPAGTWRFSATIARRPAGRHASNRRHDRRRVAPRRLVDRTVRDRPSAGERGGGVRHVHRVARPVHRGRCCWPTFFRVDPEDAETPTGRRIGRVHDTTRERCADDGLLPAVAKRRTLPAVEAAALQRLRDPRRWVVVDAAAVPWPNKAGPAGKAALLEALDAWHAAWVAARRPCCKASEPAVRAGLGQPRDGAAADRALAEANVLDA